MELITIKERVSSVPLTVRYTLRAVVPEKLQGKYETTVKAESAESTQLELDIQQGNVVEFSSEISGPNIEEIKEKLVKAQLEFQRKINGDESNKWKYSGTCWDGTTWTDGGIK